MPCFLTQNNLECFENKWAENDFPSHEDIGFGVEDTVSDSHNGTETGILGIELGVVYSRQGYSTWLGGEPSTTHEI